MSSMPFSDARMFPINTSSVKPVGGSSGGLALDTRSLEALRNRAAADPKGNAREATKQFEALFMGEMLKSMRASTMATGMLDNQGTQLGTELLDKQLASTISGRSGGLSESIMKLLERQMGMAPGPIPATRSANNTPEPLQVQPLRGEPQSGTQVAQAAPTRVPQTGAAGFVQQHMDSARDAEEASGIPASFMVSQAALETGWGRKEIKHSDGSPSYNLFGIKAGGSWNGPVAEVATTEYISGKATRVMAKFRAYGSYAESFADYAKLMVNSPRYSDVVRTAEKARATDDSKDLGKMFAQNMQRAGYATDPNYADKLSRVINTTLRLQRSMVA